MVLNRQNPQIIVNACAHITQITKSGGRFQINACQSFSLPYSRKYWRSLNLAVWAPNDVFHTIQDLNLAVWYGIAIRTCTWKKFWRILIYRQTVKFNSPPNFLAIRYVVCMLQCMYQISTGSIATCRWKLRIPDFQCLH